MTQTKRRYDLSRRKVLAGLGAVGLASAGAGLGTTAFFSDEETYENNSLVAGALDMKVDWEEHYSDWSDDEAEFAEMAASPEEADYVLPAPAGNPNAQDIRLAFIGDDTAEARDAFWDATSVEAYPDGLQNGGAQDGRQDDFPDEAACFFLTDVGPDDQGLDSVLRTRGSFAGQTTNPGDPLINVSDVKPGDFGEVTFSFHLCDNPGYVWMNGALVSADEGEMTEPEVEDPDEDQLADGSLKDENDPDGPTVELLDELQVRIWYDDGDNQLAAEEEVFFLGSLRDALDALSGNSRRGIPLDGDRSTPFDELEDEENDPGRDCFAGEGSTHYVGFEWWLPIDHGNQVQGDSVAFDLGFYTEQCRHNDGAGMGFEQLVTLDVESPQGQGQGFANAWDASSALAHRGSGSWGTVDHSGTSSSYKQGFYFGGQFSNFHDLPAFTVGDIEEVSYWLYEPTALEGNDIYLNVYTVPENDGDDAASWYDSRLQALPAEANNGSPNFTPGQWNLFSTKAGASNVLNFYDSGRATQFGGPIGKPAAADQPTLSSLQAGDVDWSNYGTNAANSPYSYHDETVLALSLQTNSTSPGLVAYVDDVTVELTDGTTLVIDLEP